MKGFELERRQVIGELGGCMLSRSDQAALAKRRKVAEITARPASQNAIVIVTR